MLRPRTLLSRAALLWTPAVLLILAACSPASEEPATTRPNFVVLLADDLGWNDVGYHGGEYPTPNIDRLAKRSALLESFYVQPLCSPTRAAFLTGRYPIRYGLQSCALRPWAEAGLALDEVTLADSLRELGYETAIVGKWHLGHYRPEYLPTRRGFDHQYGPFNGGVNYVTHERLGRLDWHRDDQSLNEEGYATSLIAREATRLIRTHDFTQPLFLYVPFTAVHSPRSAPAQLVKKFPKFEPEARRIYAAMVSSLDSAVGEVLSALDTAGVRKNTLVLFGSDNGGAPGMGDNAPLRGFKGDMSEGGVRTSWIANWPGRVTGGTVVKEPIHVVDLYPTLIGLAGGEIEGARLDGFDVFDVVRGEGLRASDELLLYSGPRGGAIRSGSLKLIVENRRGEDEPVIKLFELAMDPEEMQELSQSRAEGLQRLRARLDEWVSQAVEPVQIEATRPKDFEPPTIWGQP